MIAWGEAFELLLNVDLASSAQCFMEHIYRTCYGPGIQYDSI